MLTCFCVSAVAPIAVPPSSVFWILASGFCRDPHLCARTASLLTIASVPVIVENRQAALSLIRADFPNAWLCHLSDPLPSGHRVAHFVSAVHLIVLWYAHVAGPLKEIDPCQACDFLIPPNVRGSV